MSRSVHDFYDYCIDDGRISRKECIVLYKGEVGKIDIRAPMPESLVPQRSLSVHSETCRRRIALQYIHYGTR
jgi:hypothetical protein